jgi:hypothetical protein
MTPPGKAHRGTICLEDGRVLAHEAFEGAAVLILRIEAPRCAARATPGSFVHLRCDDDIPMRRPLSIMRVDREAGWIDVLYKIVGAGLAAPGRAASAMCSPAGPDRPGLHAARRQRPRTLLLGGGVGIPPMVFLAESLREATVDRSARPAAGKPLVLMGSEIPFPFRARPSTILVPGMPAGTIACDAAARWLGRAEPAREPQRISRLLRRLRHRAGRRLAAALSPAAKARPRWRCSPADRRRCSKPPRSWRGATACPARCRSRSSWPVRRRRLRRLRACDRKPAELLALSGDEAR